MLNEFSQQFADRLFARYHDWRGLWSARVGATVLELEIPCPNPNARTGPCINSDCDELTVGFDQYHTHFFGRDDESNSQDALEFIDAILAEEMVILIYHKGGEWLKSMAVRLIDFWPPPDPGVTRIVRSWNGSLDAEWSA
ncbi:MAG: hypothetical protein KF708_09940 [Pirellulales bacterium]|nr:hypothetical protein [Pirellulales bacterium]